MLYYVTLDDEFSNGDKKRSDHDARSLRGKRLLVSPEHTSPESTVLGLIGLESSTLKFTQKVLVHPPLPLEFGILIPGGLELALQ